MNPRRTLLIGAAGLAALLSTACGNAGTAGQSTASEASGFQLDTASNGFGTLLPHRIRVADSAGMPTDEIVEIRTQATLLNNVTLDNPILPVTQWPTAAKLPNGDAGNHFFYAKFNRALDVSSVLSAAAGSGVSGNLTGSLKVLRINAENGETIEIPGRPFIGGMTFGRVPGVDGNLPLEQWVGLTQGQDGQNNIEALVPDGEGFPGTESDNGFAGIADLVSPLTFVFVPDADDDLSTHETFPDDVQIQVVMNTGIRSTKGDRLRRRAVASTTVGDDSSCPEVALKGNSQQADIIPGNGDIDVDPATSILVHFTEPVQVRSIGAFDDGTPPIVEASINLEFGPDIARVAVPFSVRIPSVLDLTTIELMPAFEFPGSGPEGVTGGCGNFSVVDVRVAAEQFEDLRGNANLRGPQTFFTTKAGRGLVNAPVVPDAIYIGRGGNDQAISVIDLNGFGQGTGNPTFDVQNPIVQGNSNYPNNPNLVIQGSQMIPPMNFPQCTFDGGSAGVFTLTKDTSLNDKLAGSPLLSSVGDMALGHALDNAFNNSSPFGCQAGSGNLCAQTGLKVTMISQGGANTLSPTVSSGNVALKTITGAENLVSWAPHPNPPPLTFPPLCLAPNIGGKEPTSIDVQGLVLGGTLSPIGGLQNLLTPGAFPLGVPNAQPPVPPTGILSTEQNAFFQGPSQQQTNVSNCQNFMIRQQIGHFLYVVDRQAAEVVVLNSNRFTVLDRIQLPDPTSLAMAPGLDYLAVTNQRADTVSFIDTNPSSATFHEIIQTTRVGRGPIGIAWEPGNEDIIVCNEADSSVSIISAFTFRVRKTLINQLSQPFEVAITPRQIGFGYSRQVYFAYVLNGDGSVAVYESGPNGINGWGFDDIVGRLPFTFNRPKTIQPDLTNLLSAVWVAHENQLGSNGGFTGLTGGAVTNLTLTNASQGLVPLGPNAFGSPTLRDLGYSVTASIGSDELTGIPVDIAFDNQRNSAALTNFATSYSAGIPLSINGKSIVKAGNPPAVASAPRFMFLAVPDSTEGPGVVDVINLETGFRRADTNSFDAGVQSIPAPAANVVVDFFRQ